MSKKYSFWYQEVKSFKGTFKADDSVAALEMLDMLVKGDIDLTDLAGFTSSEKEFELIAEPYTLKEIDSNE